MNNERRKRIAEARQLLSDALEIIQEVASDEREAFNNLSESLQNSERGETIGAAADAAESAESSLEETLSYLDEAAG